MKDRSVEQYWRADEKVRKNLPLGLLMKNIQDAFFATISETEFTSNQSE